MAPKKGKLQKASKKTTKSRIKSRTRTDQAAVEANTPSPQQRDPSPDSETGDAAAQQLLREQASSANNTPTKPSPDRGLTQFLETRSADKDRGGGKLKRPSDQHRAPKSPKNDLNSSTIEHLKKFVTSPIKSRRSDDPYEFSVSPAKTRSPDRLQPFRAISRTGEKPSLPPKGKRSAATVEAEDAPQSKRAKVTQSKTARPQKRDVARTVNPAEEELPQKFSLAKPAQGPFLVSSDDDLFVTQQEQDSSPVREAVSEGYPSSQGNGHGNDDNTNDEVDEVSQGGPEASLREILKSPSNARRGRAVQPTEPTKATQRAGYGYDPNNDTSEAEMDEDDADSDDEANGHSGSQPIAQTEDPVELAESIDDPEEENYDALPLFGQGSILGQVFRANKEFRHLKVVRKFYNTQSGPKQLLSEMARKIYKTAQTLVIHLEREMATEEELRDDFIECLDSIVRAAARLNPEDVESPRSMRKFVNHVFVYILPSIVDLLQGLVDHVCRAARNMGLQKLRLSEVEAIRDISQCVASLERRGREWRTKLKQRIASFKNREEKRDWTTEWEKMGPVVANFRTNIVAPLNQVGRAAGTQLRVLEQARKASMEHARQLQSKEDFKITQRNRAVKAAAAREKQARVSQLLFKRQQAERDPRMRMAYHSFIPKPPESIAPRIRNTDANGEQFERVGMFGRSQRDEPFYEVRYGEEPWTDEERHELLTALQEWHGPKLWDYTFKYFCRPKDPLRKRTASELLRQAKYMRDTFMRCDEDDGEMDVFDEWMTDIPDLDLIEFL